jgi:hypothetical protein
MKKEEIREDVLVVDRWYPEKGNGVISKVLKTRVKITFEGVVETWDYPHAKLFLETVK